MPWKIKNWREFQHYKERDPPWIKVHKRLLTNREWHSLSGDDAKALVMIWLIASERDGVLPITEHDASNPLAAYEDLAFMLRLNSAEIPQLLEHLGQWIENDASVMQANGKHAASKPLDRAEHKEAEQRKETNLSEATDDALQKQEASLAHSRSGLPLARSAKESNQQPRADIAQAVVAIYKKPKELWTDADREIIKQFGV
jgi:hypothetical protein